MSFLRNVPKGFISSYDPKAPVPTIGRKAVWEPHNFHAREEIEVLDVIWNGEEWWVKTNGPSGVHLNDLSRFWEALQG